MFAGSAGGAGAANQVRPPSVVSRISTAVRHGFTWGAHGDSASSQPVDPDAKLADRTSIRFAGFAGAPATVAAPIREAALPAVARDASPAEHAVAAVRSAVMIRNPT